MYAASMSTADELPEQPSFPSAAERDPLWNAATKQAAIALETAKADVARRQEIVSLLGRLARAMTAANVDAAARVLSDPRTAAIAETYYDARVGPGLHAGLGYQFIVNPAYNADRGPVSVFSLRLRAAF